MSRNEHAVEVYSNTNWIVRRFIYGGISRKPGEYIFPLIQVNFDGFLLPAPREWKNILHTLYGDFMTVPENEPLGHIIIDPLHSCDEVNESLCFTKYTRLRLIKITL